MLLVDAWGTWGWDSFHVAALVGFVRTPRERHQPAWDAKVWIQERVDAAVAPVGMGLGSGSRDPWGVLKESPGDG